MTNYKKIIMLVETTFTKRDYERFGVNILQDNGFEVEVWDLTPFLNPKILKKDEMEKIEQFNSYRLFYNLNHFCDSVRRLDRKENLVLTFILYTMNNFKIFKALSRNKIDYCLYAAGGSHPLCTRKIAAVKSKFIIFLKIKRIKKIKHKIKLFIFNKFSKLAIRPPNFILAGGLKTNLGSIPIGSSTEIIWAHYLDYDNYLKELTNSTQAKGKKAVFLDGYLPFHPDWTYCNISQRVPPAEYYPFLCDFFDKIEKLFGFEVVIAAHPRSNYENHPDYFKGRKIVKGKTAKLVKESEIVFAHYSFSIDYAVLFNKPVLLLTMDSVKKFAPSQIATETMAEVIGKEPLNISKPFNFDPKRDLSIDQDKYRLYKHFFIKKEGTPEEPFWQIVANRIKSYNPNQKS